jgi:hypothetical protein
MIQNDLQLRVTQERIQLFVNVLVKARMTYSPSSYCAMSQAFLAEIRKMQDEIRAYLSSPAQISEAA